MKRSSRQFLILTTQWKEFLAEVTVVFSNMPIKYRQVLIPLVDEQFQAVLRLASSATAHGSTASESQSLVRRWQTIFEICLLKGIMKETKISQLAGLLGELKDSSVKLAAEERS